MEKQQRSKAVRETGVSRHHGDSIEAPTETPIHHNTIRQSVGQQ